MGGGDSCYATEYLLQTRQVLDIRAFVCHAPHDGSRGPVDLVVVVTPTLGSFSTTLFFFFPLLARLGIAAFPLKPLKAKQASSLLSGAAAIGRREGTDWEGTPTCSRSMDPVTFFLSPTNDITRPITHVTPTLNIGALIARCHAYR